MPGRRLLLILTEHSAGVTPALTKRYGELRRQLAGLTPARVETAPYESLDAIGADAMVLSGSSAPWDAHDQQALDSFIDMLGNCDRPTLGICAGMQLQARASGGTVGGAPLPVSGFQRVDVLDDSDLLAGVGREFHAFQEHTDEVTFVPDGFRVIASSDRCPVEALAASNRPWWGTQFHPERWTNAHPAGRTILERFVRLAKLGP